MSGNIRHLTPNEQLEEVLNKLNAKHPGLWDRGESGFPDYRLQFKGNDTIIVELLMNHSRVEGEIRGLYSQFCELRSGMGKLVKETLAQPAFPGLSLSTCPDVDGAQCQHAWLHLSGMPVVFGRWHTHHRRFKFHVPLGALEAIVDALANARTEGELAAMPLH
jgi:hypothetical protein